jgi:hypothetical protein
MSAKLVSARSRRSTSNAFASAVARMFASPLAPANDFQLQGR